MNTPTKTGFYLVDVEASGRTPHSGHMTEFGVVELVSRRTFHGSFYDTHPDPKRPGLPVIDGPHQSVAVDQGPPVDVADDRAVYDRLLAWLDDIGHTRCVFVSDNPGFDNMWFATGIDAVGLDNPFGFSSRRIGDLAAGLTGDWRRTNDWKRLRRTRHTHHPVDDAMGNAEALDALLRRHNQKLPT